MDNIPHILSIYWGGNNLSWLRYMTVVSFLKYNPDWKVYLYVPAVVFKGKITWDTKEQSNPYKGECWLERLKKLCTVCEVNMEEFGWSNNIPEVLKSDFIRNKVIADHGGLWSDLDIIYCKPLTQEFLEADIVHCFQEGTHFIGFIAGKKGSVYHEELFNMIHKHGKGNRRYQGIGSFFLNKHSVSEDVKKECKIFNIPMSYVYNIPWNKLQLFEDENYSLPDSSIAIHWFGGSTKSTKWENYIVEDSLNNDDRLLCRLLREVVK